MKLTRHIAAVLLAGTVAAGLTGCSLREERGTLIGAGIGLVAGALIDHDEPGRGAIIGAAAGAIGGYAVTSEHDHHYRSRGRRSPGYRSHGHDDHGYGGYRDPYDDCDY